MLKVGRVAIQLFKLHPATAISENEKTIVKYVSNCN